MLTCIEDLSTQRLLLPILLTINIHISTEKIILSFIFLPLIFCYILYKNVVYKVFWDIIPKRHWFKKRFAHQFYVNKFLKCCNPVL